jgi:predicted RND superfamily exporter protein
VVLMILIPLFAATANWAEPKKQITPLAITGSALILAFGALYYLEHVYWASGH